LSREGYGTIAGTVFFTAALVVGAIVSGQLYLEILAAIGVALTLLVLYFFRDPERQIPSDPKNIVSPADGKIVEIVEDYEPEYLKEKTTRISIFLSVFDVHVNRIPISGTVEHVRYQKGSFIQAYKSEASSFNEQSVIGIEGSTCKLVFKQIAGILARRIVCHLRAGNKVSQGDRFGIIKFGSRVDIFIPKNTEIKVRLKQKVKGGESILGVLTHDS